MSDFESDLLNVVKHSLTNQLKKENLISIPYDQKVKLPDDFMQKAWGFIDQEALLGKLAERLESELIDRLVNQMAAEIATDIKQVLSVKERREAVRSVVRDNIDKLTKI